MLTLAPNLKLSPEDTLEMAIGVLGKRGRGKSGAVKVFMEELCHAKLPFIGLDPVGIMWGLRSSLDGTGPGYPVLVIGGSHGDIPLDRRAGADIARAVMEANVSAIVDFSQESKRVYREFVRDFAHELYRGNQTSRMVILEEASELVPQRLRPDMTEVYESVERLVVRGRNKGIGVTMVDVRPAKINKDVLSEVDLLLIFGVVSPQDRKCLQEWVELHDDAKRLKEFEQGLAALERQEAWAWAPEKDIFRKVRFRDFRTFHPDKTHLRRSGLLKVQPVTTDVQALVAKLGPEMERLAKEKVEKASVPQLQRRIAELQARVAKTPPPPLPKDRALEERLHAALKQLSHAKQQQRHVVALLKTYPDELREMASGFEKRMERFTEMLEREPGNRSQEPVIVGGRNDAPSSGRSVSPLPQTDTSGISPAEQRILQALAELAAIGIREPTKVQAALWTPSARGKSYAPDSGGWNNYLGKLRTKGLIAYPRPGVLGLTEEGQSAAGPVNGSATVSELQDRVRHTLGPSMWRILEVLIGAYPEAMAKSQLADAAEFSADSGGFNNYLGRMRSMGLIDYPAPGEAKACPVLFLEGAS